MKYLLTLMGTALLGISQLQAVNNRSTKLALNMYSSQRAYQVGDLLTINISESTSSSKQESLSTNKVSSATSGTNNSFDAGGSNIPVVDQIKSAIDTIYKNTPTYNLSADSSFNGAGSSSSSESLNMTFTVRVIDILDNGVLAVRGERSVVMKNEKVNMVLSGLVRPRDISAKNIVASNRVADANIYYENGGDVTQGTQPGYFWRIFQYINPF